MSAGTPSCGREALEHFAPAPARALEQIEGAAWAAFCQGQEFASDGHPFALAARVVAAQHGLEPIAAPTGLRGDAAPSFDATRWRQHARLDESARVALAFAEQMSFDVASVQSHERDALFASLGAAAVPFVQAVYVADLVPRVRAALDSLFGASAGWGARHASEPAPDLQTAFDDWIRSVPQLQALDPVSTELVRLLGARRHRCRICQSLRNRSALVAGADETLFEAVDRHAESALSSAHRALLAFADAMILPPGQVGPDLAARLRAAYPAAACVEVVLDIARNAANKVAVALGADTPNVESGIEIYDVGPDGELLYGLEAP